MLGKTHGFSHIPPVASVLFLSASRHIHLVGALQNWHLSVSPDHSHLTNRSVGPRISALGLDFSRRTWDSRACPYCPRTWPPARWSSERPRHAQWPVGWEWSTPATIKASSGFLWLGFQPLPVMAVMVGFLGSHIAHISDLSWSIMIYHHLHVTYMCGHFDKLEGKKEETLKPTEHLTGGFNQWCPQSHVEFGRWIPKNGMLIHQPLLCL